MRRRPHSSRSRFARYKARRRETGYRERIGDRIDESREKKRASRAKRSFPALFAAFWRLIRGHRLTVAAALATLSVSTVLGLIMPASTKVIIDYVLTDNPGPAALPAWLTGDAPDITSADQRVRILWIISGAMIALTCVTISIAIWGRWQCTRISMRLRVLMRRRVFEHASRLPLEQVQELRSGGVASLLREDAGAIGDLVFSLIYNPWRAITQLSGTLVILAWVDWRLLLGALALIPLIFFSHRTWIGRIRPLYRDIRATRQGIDAASAEAFAGMRVVRGFNRRKTESARFAGSNHFMSRQEMATWWWARGLEIIWQVLIPLATIVVLMYAGSRIIRTSFGDAPSPMTIGDLMMFLLYLGWLLGPLESLVSSATNVQNSLAGLDRTLDILAHEREFENNAESERKRLDPELVLGAIRFENVSFAYPPRDDTAEPKTVLSGITLDVAPGETIALVGPSGAGKTTLCNLVARFYDPSQGRILLDGTDLRDISVDSYRRLLGIVEQDVFLFDGTIAQNIGYARREATMEQIERAARLANAHTFITDTENAYDTLIGERGVRLSGGQKQRIAIARAILADPRLLILDEATSNLDTESEALIQDSLSELLEGRTSFVIAHRLSTVRHADRIIVIEDGAIAELGTHEELLASGGRYAKVLRMQIGELDDLPDHPALEH